MVFLRQFLMFLILVFPYRPMLADLQAAKVDTSRFYLKHDFDVLKYKLEIDLFNCYSAPYSKLFRVC